MRVLKSKSKLFLYGIGAMGINLLNLIIGSYLCDALMTEGFDVNIEFWTYSNKTLVWAAVWSIMTAIAKVVDGVIDIPLAAFSDNLRSRFGRRRPALLIGVIPMVLAYIAFLNPIFPNAATDGQLIGNSIWLGFVLCVFYAFYTLTMGTYYATFSEIVDNDQDRIALSNFKTIADIIYFVLGYGLIPMLISPGHLNIKVIGYILLPLVLLILIPIFFIKEPSNLISKVGSAKPSAENKQDENAENLEEEPATLDTSEGVAALDTVDSTAAALDETPSSEQQVGEEPQKEKYVGLIESLKYCIKNKSFMLWMAVYSVLQFGLQMFIGGMNVYFSGAMKLEGWQQTVLMACVMAPVPLTLLLYNKITKMKGLKVGYLFSVGAFAAAMIMLTFCSTEVIPYQPETHPEYGYLRLVIGIIGALIASFGIGCFFSISYTVPSSLADIERRKTGVSNPTMYFAVQGFCAAIAVAISSLIWINLKKGGVSWLLPIFTFVACGISFGLTFLLPKELGMTGRVQTATESVGVTGEGQADGIENAEESVAEGEQTEVVEESRQSAESVEVTGSLEENIPQQSDEVTEVAEQSEESIVGDAPEQSDEVTEVTEDAQTEESVIVPQQSTESAEEE